MLFTACLRFLEGLRSALPEAAPTGGADACEVDFLFVQLLYSTVLCIIVMILWRSSAPGQLRRGGGATP